MSMYIVAVGSPNSGADSISPRGVLFPGYSRTEGICIKKLNSRQINNIISISQVVGGMINIYYNML